MSEFDRASDVESDTHEADPSGAMGSARAIGATLATLWHTRLDLLLTELEEERQRVLGTLLWGALSLVAGAFALAAVAALVVVLAWENHRILALSAITVIFVVGTVGAGWQALRLARRRERFLAASMAELEADRQRWFSQEQV